jgi:hypothetical protein
MKIPKIPLSKKLWLSHGLAWLQPEFRVQTYFLRIRIREGILLCHFCYY